MTFRRIIYNKVEPSLYLSTFVFVSVLVLFAVINKKPTRPKKRSPAPESAWAEPKILGLPLRIKRSHRNDSLNQNPFQYVSLVNVMTRNESQFYGHLLNVLDESVVILAKVRIADIINPDAALSKSEWHSHFLRISQKHVDYLVCSRHGFQILCAIELDDSTHMRNKVIERDRFVNMAFKSAGIPLYRVPLKYAGDAKYLTDLLGL